MNISNLIFKCIYYYCYTKPRGVEILLWYTKQGAAALSLWFNLLAEVYFRMTCINYCLWHFDTLTKVNDWWTATKKREVDCSQRKPLGKSAKIAAPREPNQTGCSSCDSLHCIPSLYLTVSLPLAKKRRKFAGLRDFAWDCVWFVGVVREPLSICNRLERRNGLSLLRYQNWCGLQALEYYS